MRSQLLQLMGSKNYRPMTKSELARTLELHPNKRASMRQTLSNLEKEGLVIRGKKARWELASARNKQGEVEGIFSYNYKGHGIFKVTKPAKNSSIQIGDIFPVDPKYQLTALPLDQVLVHLVKKSPPRWSQTHKTRSQNSDQFFHQARVQQILVRNFHQFVGTVRRRGSQIYIQPLQQGLPLFLLDQHHPFVSPITSLPAEDSVVTCVFRQWNSPRETPQAQIIEVVESSSATKLAIEILIRKQSLPLSFPQVVDQEANQLPSAPQEQSFQRREDWRDQPVFTIDPIDAKDFDDAIFVEKTPQGGWNLTVHIADVSYYVAQGSAMDKEAFQRGNSTYLADRVIPMLPETLSNGLCSLVPNENRLTFAVTIPFDQTGSLAGKPQFFRSVICSKRRFHYGEVQALFESVDKAPETQANYEQDPVFQSLFQARKLAKILRKKRFNNGSLELDFPELKVLCDSKGNPTDYQIERSDESHQLIEECMLAANEATAKKLLQHESAGIHRVHEDPDPARLFELGELAKSFGHNLGDLSNRANLNKLLQQVRGTAEEQAIKIATLKSMAQARYETESLGHYGLAKPAYTHFTSPIRRYADLVVHRVLLRHLPTAPQNKHSSTLAIAKAKEIATHISKTERVSAEAERASRRIVLLHWLETQCHPNGAVLKGFIGEINPRFAFVDLPELSLRGMIKTEDLPSDNYRFDYRKRAIVGQFTDVYLAAGEKIYVRALRVDQEQGYLDLTIAESSPKT